MENYTEINIQFILDLLALKPNSSAFIMSIYKDETHPSLKIYFKTQSYYCFATNQGGGAIKFYADYHKISWIEAYRELKQKYPEHFSSELYSGSSQVSIQKAETKYDLLESEKYFFDERAGFAEEVPEVTREQANKIAFNQLVDERSAIQVKVFTALKNYCDNKGMPKDVFDYLTGASRNLKPESISRFGIFAIADPSNVVDFLYKNFDSDELRISGLFNENGNFIFWNHRIIIPYYSEEKITFLRARYFDKEGNSKTSGAKYLSLINFSTNLGTKRFYNKNVLNTLEQAERVIICEGEFDTIVATEFGHKAIGILGCGNIPSESDLARLNNNNIYLCFDSDEAGTKACMKFATLAKRNVFRFKLKQHNDLSELSRISSSLLYHPSVELELVQPANIIQNDSNADIKFNQQVLNKSYFKMMLEHYDKLIESPTEFIMTSLIATLSGAIGKKVFLEVGGEGKIYANVYSVIIGPSTLTKKSTAIKKVSAVLATIAQNKDREFELKSTIYNQQVVKEKTPDVEPPKRDYILLPNDATVESLAVILSQSERGLIVLSEFGGYLAQLERKYQAGAKGFLTDIFDCPVRHEVSRIQRGNVLLESPYLAILGSTTIDWFTEASSTSDILSGFYPRILFSIINNNRKEHTPLLARRNNKLSNEDPEYIREIFERLTSNSKEIIFEIEEAAVSLHNSYSVNIHKELSKTVSEQSNAFQGRLIIYALKFAMIIAITDNRDVISVGDMEDALNIAEYYARNVEKLLSSEMRKNQHYHHEQKILTLLKKHNGKMRHSDLLRKSGFRANRLNDLLTELKEKEIIKTEEYTHGRNGTKAIIYNLVSDTIQKQINNSNN